MITPAQEKMRSHNNVEIPLKMADFVGVFGIFWVVLVVTALVFFAEGWRGQTGKKYVEGNEIITLTPVYSRTTNKYSIFSLH